MTTRTVGRLMAETLQAHDVDLLYCVPGESYLGLTNALTEVPFVKLIICRHEGGAGFMAAADGRMRGRAGVCMVSRGPGLSNAMVALHTAFHDATPMVIIVGQVERRDFGRLALQEQNYSRLLSDVTKGVIEVNEPVMASEALARAFHLADVLLLTDIYPASEEPIPGITAEALALALAERGHRHALYAGDLRAASERLAAEVREGDVVLTLGAGSVWTAGEDLLKRRGASGEGGH